MFATLPACGGAKQPAAGQSFATQVCADGYRYTRDPNCQEAGHAAGGGGAMSAALSALRSSAFTFPAQDASGWSVLTPSSDSRLIYVSAAGNDATAQVYAPNAAQIGADPFAPTGTVAAYATLTAAMAQARAGYPDWVLLRRGDTWQATAELSVRAGRSSTERSLIGAYGAGARPVVFDYGVEMYHASYSAIVGVRFYARNRDPAAAQFVGFSSVGAPYGLSAMRSGGYNTSGGILIEDCWFDFFGGNTIQSPESTGAPYITNVIIRRSLFTNNYVTAAHSQGLFGERFSGWLEENIFDHNGWYQQGDGNNTTTAGMATMFNHNTYFENCAQVVFRNNVFLRPSSNHTKFTSNTASGTNQIKSYDIYLDNNLYVEGEIGISTGGNDTMLNGPRWSNINITNNVMMHLGRTRPTNRVIAWGIMDAQEWQGGSIDGNIIAHFGDSTVNDTRALRVYRSMSGTTISNNIFYNIGGAEPIVLFDGDAANTDTAFTGNAVHTTNAGNLISDSFTSRGTFANNRYMASAAQTGWFLRNGSTTSLAAYMTATGDTTSLAGMPSYPAPSRTVDSYLSTLGLPNIGAYAAALYAQRRGAWNTALDASAVNNYVRAGYGR